MRMLVLAGLLACATAGPAAAQDRVLDLAYPQAVADALKEAGYKAEVKRPMLDLYRQRGQWPARRHLPSPPNLPEPCTKKEIRCA